MVSQMRRASSSILANLAEGFGRITPADKKHKYLISRSECMEVHAFLLIAAELEYIDNELSQKAIELTRQTGKLLSGLIHSQK